MHTKSASISPEGVEPDDAPELTEALLKDAEFFHGEQFIRRGAGRPKTGAAKELISVRLDTDVVAKLREAGPGWQSQINTLLRQALKLEAKGKRSTERSHTA